MTGLRIQGLKIICVVLALATILVPDSLRGEGRSTTFSSSKSEAVQKLRNDVEEHWERQYKSYSPSESDREGRVSSRWKSLYDEPEPMAGSRPSNRSRRSRNYAGATRGQTAD